MVNQEHVSQIMDMGFSKVVAEKALFMSQAGVEKAMEWIEQHLDDPDFNEELVIVGKKQSEFAGLTEEEKFQKVKQMQIEARKMIEAKEKANAIEREANRKKMEKELIEAKKIMDEQQYKLAIEMKKLEQK